MKDRLAIHCGQNLFAWARERRGRLPKASPSSQECLRQSGRAEANTANRELELLWAERHTRFIERNAPLTIKVLGSWGLGA